MQKHWKKPQKPKQLQISAVTTAKTLNTPRKTQKTIDLSIYLGKHIEIAKKN